MAFQAHLCYYSPFMTIEAMNILIKELDAWSRADMTAELWWRDDDAAKPTVELDTLFHLSERFGVPCGLAVIPATTGEPLRKDVSNQSQIWVLQHGYAHINHVPGSGKAWELGAHRPKSVILDELRDGMGKLSQLFKTRFVPALVPPWNRIDSELLPYLPVMGFAGISTSYSAHRLVPPGDLRVADAHCDVLRWKEKPPRFTGTEKAIKLIVEHLKAKRTAQADETEPTCVLTHHLVMDKDAWDFMDNLLAMTTAHPAATWLSPVDIWPAS